MPTHCKSAEAHFQMPGDLENSSTAPTFSPACCIPDSPPSFPLIPPHTLAWSQHTTSPGLASKLRRRWDIFYPSTISHPVVDLLEIAISPHPAFSPCHDSCERDCGWALCGESSDGTGSCALCGWWLPVCKVWGMGI